MSQEPKKVERRSFLGYAVAAVAGLVVGAAGTYALIPSGTTTTTTAPGTTVTGPTVTSTVPTTITKTVTGGTSTVTSTTGTTSTVTSTTGTTSTVTSTTQQYNQYAGKTAAIAVGSGGSTAFSGICYHYQPIVTALTQGALNVIELAYSDLPVKILADQSTGAFTFDMCIPCSNLMGDLVVPGYTEPVATYYGKPGYPQWNQSQNPPGNAQCSKWGATYYGIPWDNDAWYYYINMKQMNAVLRDSTKSAEFQSKYGYKLNPYGWIRDRKLSWQKVKDTSEFFTGWDWNGDGAPDFGLEWSLETGQQSSFWFYALAGPYIQEYGPTRDATHNLFFVDPTNINNIFINSKQPGIVAATQMYQSLVPFMNPADFSHAFAEDWDAFLNKELSMMMFQAPDPLSLAGSYPNFRGNLMATPTPGTDTYYSLTTSSMVNKFNQVGNWDGCSWHPFILSHGENKDLAYWFSAYVATPEEHFITSTSSYVWTGCDPGAFTSDLLKDYGGTQTDLTAWNLPADPNETFPTDPGPDTTLPFTKQAKYNEYDLRRGEQCIINNLNGCDGIEDYFKIDGATALFTSVDTHITGELMTGASDIPTALDRVQSDWVNSIVPTYGTDALLKEYQGSIGYGGSNPYPGAGKWIWDPKLIPSDVID